MAQQQDIHRINLVGPCGFYCGACSHYLAREKGRLAEKNLKRGCLGCRAQDKKCAWIKRDCALVRQGEVEFCYECADFPCANLIALDQRHVRDDGVSMIENLLRIRAVGLERWLDEQEQRWRCPQCGGSVCLIDRMCYDCGVRVGR